VENIIILFEIKSFIINLPVNILVMAQHQPCLDDVISSGEQRRTWILLRNYTEGT